MMKEREMAERAAPWWWGSRRCRKRGSILLRSGREKAETQRNHGG